MMKKIILPCAIKRFKIENYQGIIRTKIADLPGETQWIFLTGENGYGKTSLLQAIAICLFGKQDNKRNLTENDCKITVEFNNHGNNQINRLGTPQFQPLAHFVAYGSSRLEIQNQHTRNEVSEKSTTIYGLFNTDGVLLSIEYEIFIGYLKKNPKFSIIKKTLLKFLPYIADIQINDKDEIVYIERHFALNLMALTLRLQIHNAPPERGTG